VTEEVTGIDIVKAQIHILEGYSCRFTLPSRSWCRSRPEGRPGPRPDAR
jgi:biotin carboxylase